MLIVEGLWNYQMDTPDPKSSRLTIVNSDRSSNEIIISKTLLTRLTSKDEPSKEYVTQSNSQQLQNNLSPTQEGTVESEVQKQPDDLLMSEESRVRYADYDANQASDDVQDYDSWSALRDEYECKLKKAHQTWKDRYADLEELNKRLLKQNGKKLAAAVNDVEMRHTKHSTSGKMPCKDIETNLLQCYTDNPKATLLCSDLVKAFADCVKSASSEAMNTESK